MSETNQTKMGEPICYLQVRTRSSVQEHYCTQSRHAAKRARVLRQAGYRVLVSALGDQVTNVGRCRMTMVTVLDNGNLDDLPVVRIERGV